MSRVPDSIDEMAGPRETNEERAERLQGQLRQQLAPELWEVVYDYGEAKEHVGNENYHRDLYLMVECIAAHFPGFAPAILCMIQHAFDSDYGRGGECGVVPVLDPRRSGADE